MTPIAWTLKDGKSTPELFHTQSMDSRKEALRLFADRLKQLRLKRKLSQEGLAELAGMNRNYVGEVERGKRNPCLYNIVKLAEVLRVHPSELFRNF